MDDSEDFGVLCATQALGDTQVGKAMPFSIFSPVFGFFFLLNTDPVSFFIFSSPNLQSETTVLPGFTSAVISATTSATQSNKSKSEKLCADARPLRLENSREGDIRGVAQASNMKRKKLLATHSSAALQSSKEPARVQW
jgi:hypothetical protein